MLMRRIESGRFHPGERIIPKEVALELGVSTIPVREALCVLVGRGVVVEQRNKGFTVAPMTSATLRALYAAHGDVIEKALRRWPSGVPFPGRSHNRWTVFSAIARHASDHALIGMQYYLASRLAIARRPEKAWFATKGMDWNIAQALRDGNMSAAQTLIREFHEECQKYSSHIWQILSDR
jgi:hypothetical protein